MKKTITILAVVIIFALCIIVYTNLVEKDSGNPDNVQPPFEEHEDIVLTLSVDSASLNYSLSELLVFENVSGKGMFINKVGTIKGPSNYTGVPMVMLLDDILVPYMQPGKKLVKIPLSEKIDLLCAPFKKNPLKKRIGEDSRVLTHGYYFGLYFIGVLVYLPSFSKVLIFA